MMIEETLSMLPTILVICLTIVVSMLVLLLILFGIELYFFRKRDPRSMLIRLGTMDKDES